MTTSFKTFVEGLCRFSFFFNGHFGTTSLSVFSGNVCASLTPYWIGNATFFYWFSNTALICLFHLLQTLFCAPYFQYGRLTKASVSFVKFWPWGWPWWYWVKKALKRIFQNFNNRLPLNISLSCQKTLCM